MNNQNVEEARRRAFQYQFEDGLVEIGYGAVYAILGLLLWVINTISTGGQNKWWFAVGILLFSLVCAGVLAALVKRYKEQVTYPRTGRVTSEHRPKDDLRTALLMIVAAMAIAAAAIWLEGWFVSSNAIVGATLTLLLFYFGAHAGLIRMRIAAMLPLLIGLVTAYFGFDETVGSALAIGITGLAVLVIGLFALRSYLANNPLPDNKES